MKLLKKVVSMLVVVCLMMGVANIPVYAYTAVGPVEYSQEYNLQTEYVTPAQAVKKATAEKATAKPAAKKAKAAKKTTATKKAAKKAVSLTSQITKKYTKKGLQALKAVANKAGLKLKTVYNAFVKMGVTKAQMKKVASNIVKLLKKGGNFINCASLAVSKYLGISKSLAAVYNLAGDITCGAFNSSTKAFNGTGYGATLALQKNGHKNATDCVVTLNDLVTNLKKGQKAIISVECYNKSGKSVGGHAITVKREKNGKYSVYDILINGGNKITYTAKEFKKVLNGKSAKGKTASGRTITKNKYLNSVDGYIRYKTDKNSILITTESSSLKKASFKTTGAYKMAQETLSDINKLLKKSNVSSLAKTYLKEAKALINKVINSNKSYESKLSFFSKTSMAMKEISKENAAIWVLSKYCSTSKDNFIYSAFYPIRSVLKGNKVYETYMEEGEYAAKLIS